MNALVVLAAYAPPERDCGGDVNDITRCAGMLPWAGIGIAWGVALVLIGILFVLALASSPVVTFGGSWFERVVLGLTPEPPSSLPIPQTAPDDVPPPGTVPPVEAPAPGEAPPQVAPDGVPPPGVPVTPNSEPGVEAPAEPGTEPETEPEAVPLPAPAPPQAKDESHGSGDEGADEGGEESEGDGESGDDAGADPDADGDDLPAEVTAVLEQVHALYAARVRAVERADAFEGAAVEAAGDAPGRAELAEAAADAARDAEAAAATDLSALPDLLGDLVNSPAVVADDLDAVGFPDALATRAIAVHDGLEGLQKLYGPARELAEAAEAAWHDLADPGTDDAREAADRSAEGAEALAQAVEAWADAVDKLIATLTNRLYRGAYSASTLDRLRKGISNAAPGLKKIEQILTPGTKQSVPPPTGVPTPPVGESNLATAAMIVVALARVGYQRWRSWWKRRRNR